MTLALPREIMNKVEQRWNARAPQTGAFQLSTDRLKQHGQVAATAEADQMGAPTSQDPIKQN